MTNSGSNLVYDNATGHLLFSSTSGHLVNGALLSIVTATLPTFYTGTAASFQMRAAGGNGTYSWSITSGKPSWMSISSAGLITGTPSATGSGSITFQVSDGTHSVTTTLAYTVASGSGPVLTISYPTSGTLPLCPAGTVLVATFSGSGQCRHDHLFTGWPTDQLRLGIGRTTAKFHALGNPWNKRGFIIFHQSTGRVRRQWQLFIHALCP